MAVVVDPKDVDEFMGYAEEENLRGNKGSCRNRGAKTCDYHWRGKKIVDLIQSIFRY